MRSMTHALLFLIAGLIASAAEAPDAKAIMTKVAANTSAATVTKSLMCEVSSLLDREVGTLET